MSHRVSVSNVLSAYDIAPLPLTVQHHPLEPATSLISRLAARNGAASAKEFCLDIEFPYKPLVRGDRDAIAKLAYISGCNAEKLRRVSIRNIGRSALRLRDEWATIYSLHRVRIHLCPECIREDAQSPAETWRTPRKLTWQFTSIRSCPEHHCALISLPDVQFTLQGHDFALQLRKHWQLIERVECTPQKHTAFESYLWRRIAGERGQTWLDELELNVAGRACEVFGLLLAQGADGKLSGHSESEWARFGELGFDVFRGGPAAITEEMARMLSRPGIDRRFFSRVYGPFTTWLNNRGLGDEFEPLRDIVRHTIFASFAVRRGILVLGKPSPGADRSKSADPLPLDEMPEDLLRLMRQRGLVQIPGDGKALPKGFVTSATIKAVHREYEDLVNIASAAKMIELSPEELKAQINTGTLPVRLITQSGEHLLDCGMLQPRRHSSNATNQPGTTFHPAAADRAILTVAEAAQRLKISERTVFFLTRNGFLGVARGSGTLRAGTTAINVLSLAAFEDIFVSIGRLAALSRTPQGALAIRLGNKGVAMVAMPPGLSRIYWRNDIRAFGLPLPEPGPVDATIAPEHVERPSLPESR